MEVHAPRLGILYVIVEKGMKQTLYSRGGYRKRPEYSKHIYGQSIFRRNV